jgi:CzcA family heavy metal efflux pump
MLDRLIALSLRHRLLVIGVAALLLVWGGTTLLRLPVDVFPDLNRPTVTIMTESPGMAPEEVETLVTFPLEVALNGAPGVERVRSVSAVSLSIVFVEFGWSVDIYRARQLVAERLQLAQERLPEGLVSQLAPISSLMGEILLIGLQSEDGAVSPMELRSLADWGIRQRLLAIPGVSQVTPIGGQVQQVHVLADPWAMRAAAVTLDDVASAAGASQANTTGGFLDRAGQEWLVRNVARSARPEDIAGTAVRVSGDVPLRLGDVARVVHGPRPRRGDASVDGRPAVILAVSKQPGASTLELTERVERELSSVRAALPPGVRLQVLFRQASFIAAAIANVEGALRDGGVLVVLVLALFLANFRTTAITLCAIPLSFVVAGLVFRAFDMSINTMTLGGLAIAVGELVDDAIVDVENVLRRLRENRHAPDPRPALQVVFAASSEVRSSIVYATILVVLVFIPLFALSGMEGRLFAPLGVAYIVSIAASLVVSLTVTPALASYLLAGSRLLDRPEHGSRFVRWLQERHRRLVRWALPRAVAITCAVALLVVVAAASLLLFGSEFLPPFNEGTATVNVVSAPGISLEESNRIGAKAEEMLLQSAAVATTGRRTGRAELDEHAEGVHYSEIDVDFRAGGRSREGVLADLRARLSGLPGVAVSVGQPISHRLDHVLSGVRAQVAVKIFGPDLAVLRAAAEEARRAMVEVPGVVDVAVETQVLVPQLVVRVRRDAAAQLGLQPGGLAATLETALHGRVVSEVLDGQRVVEVVVRLAPEARETLEALRATPISLPGGGAVALGDVADVVETTGPNQISRENAQRRIVVACNVADRDLVSAVEAIRRARGPGGVQPSSPARTDTHPDRPSGARGQLRARGPLAEARRRVLHGAERLPPPGGHVPRARAVPAPPLRRPHAPARRRRVLGHDPCRGRSSARARRARPRRRERDVPRAPAAGAGPSARPRDSADVPGGRARGGGPRGAVQLPLHARRRRAAGDGDERWRVAPRRDLARAPGAARRPCDHRRRGPPLRARRERQDAHAVHSRRCGDHAAARGREGAPASAAAGRRARDARADAPRRPLHGDGPRAGGRARRRRGDGDDVRRHGEGRTLHPRRSRGELVGERFREHRAVLQPHGGQRPTPHAARVEGEQPVLDAQSQRGPVADHDARVVTPPSRHVEPRHAAGRSVLRLARELEARQA